MVLGFLRRANKQALPKPDIPEITEWLTPFMEHLDVLEKDYSFLPINKGILIYFRNYGLLWLPDEYLDKLVSSDHLKKTVLSGVTSGLKIASSIATRGLSLVVVDKLFKTIAKPPSNAPYAYFQNTIFEVQLIPIDAYKDFLADYSAKYSTTVSKDLDLEMEQAITTEKAEKGALMIVDKMSVVLEDEITKNKEIKASKERKKPFWKKSASSIPFLDVFKTSSSEQTVLYRFSNKEHVIIFLEALTQSKIRVTSRKPYH
ncbi:MAG: hypothetical protein ACTSYA_07090 [Candidatus Kariarchaeaceae archaeon]